MKKYAINITVPPAVEKAFWLLTMLYIFLVEIHFGVRCITLERARMEYRVEGTGTDTDWARGSPRSIK